MNGFDLSTISNCYFGQSACSAIYLGSTKIWPTGPHDYSQDYLTIVSTTDSNIIRWKSYASSNTKTISVSTDNGTTWTSYTSSTAGTTLATLNNGDKLLIKGNNTSYSSSQYNCNSFTSSKKCYVEGNIMSLIYSDNFVNQTRLYNSYALAYIFQNMYYLTSAENLILPATIISSNCYEYMFDQCWALVTGPELPATTLKQQCYQYMFNGCRNLNYIKCLATTWASNAIYYWVYNVQTSSGTFVKNSSATFWSRGTSGIPTNWTIQNA